jgi:hypothetical protein
VPDIFNLDLPEVFQKESSFEFEPGAFTNSSSPSSSQQRQDALKFAHMSLKHVGLFRQVLQERGTLDTNHIVAAVHAKVEAAEFQAALDTSYDSLTNSEIDAILAWEHVVTLAQGLANVMTADSAYARTFPARHTFSVLEKQG